jgi:hypothetical protein
MILRGQRGLHERRERNRGGRGDRNMLQKRTTIHQASSAPRLRDAQ